MSKEDGIIAAAEELKRFKIDAEAAVKKIKDAEFI